MFFLKRYTKVSTAICTVVLLVLLACTNEPFTILPLGVTEVDNQGTHITSRYAYRDQRITTFVQTLSSDTIRMMTFHYDGDGLDRIVIDSTEESYGLMHVIGTPRSPEMDSLYSVTPTGKILVETRRFSYDNGRLSRVEVASYGSSDTTQTVYTLEWIGSNVSRLEKQVFDGEGEATKTTVSMVHDGKSGVYSSEVAYLYTIPLDELYWLSDNNPVSFKRDTLKTAAYTYFYNSRGYPSHIRTDKGYVIGHTYTELR